MRPPHDLPVDVLAVDHVAMASWDASVQADMLTRVLGATFVTGGDAHGAGYRWLQFALPGGMIEVIEPLTRDGFLYRFLTRRGESLHHITLKVRDLAASIPRLTGAGFTPVDVDLSHEGWKEAFLSPRDTGGVLIQLAETSEYADDHRQDRSLEDFLRDRPGLRPD
jgi:hypothetical protein